ncbi:MAG: hypothetical protein RIS35_1467, partial [Pseudomonadota bacterium]
GVADFRTVKLFKSVVPETGIEPVRPFYGSGGF